MTWRGRLPGGPLLRLQSRAAQHINNKPASKSGIHPVSWPARGRVQREDGIDEVV